VAGESTRYHRQQKNLTEDGAGTIAKPDDKVKFVLGEMLQEVCERGKSLSFKIASGSMSPIIEVGNVVKISRVKPSHVRTGDIVAFREGQNVVVHRIIGKKRLNRELIFSHRGDDGAISGKIPAKDLIGRVFLIKKGEREISLNTLWSAISNKILGWKLRLLNGIGQMRHKSLGIILYQSLRPIWRPCRKLLLKHL
jgi:signal peptidase I